MSRKLKGLYRREETHGGGPEPYAPLSMFKLMMLGQWHGLSDAQLEQDLKVRIHFMVFTGFEPAAGEFPDASTICRFRNRLVIAKLDQVLLRSNNSQLDGTQRAEGRGAILDATIIPSAARPNSYIDMDGEEPQIVTSADNEARWVKKGNHAFYGYRGYGTVDTEDGYVEHIEVHPANEAEVNKLPQVIDAMTAANGIAPDGVLADKGYASKANRQYLKDRGMADLIQHKGAKGKPLLPILKKLNTAIGGLRFKVEQAFGTMPSGQGTVLWHSQGTGADVLGGVANEPFEGSSQAAANATTDAPRLRYACLSPKRGENPPNGGENGEDLSQNCSKKGKSDQKPQKAVGTLSCATVLNHSPSQYM